MRTPTLLRDLLHSHRRGLVLDVQLGSFAEPEAKCLILNIDDPKKTRKSTAFRSQILSLSRAGKQEEATSSKHDERCGGNATTIVEERPMAHIASNGSGRVGNSCHNLCL